MSRMLTLIDAGWSSIRLSATQGRRIDALNRLVRLLARPDVPTPIAADAHRLAGELLIEGEKYTDARRHLRAAAALEPRHARTQYLWALAHERDPHGCDRRAALRFRRAAKLEPANALYAASFGRALVRCDKVRTGIRELLAAADRAMGDLGDLSDLAVIRVVIDGLLEAQRPGTARRILNRAGFLCRDAIKARELRLLSERARFAIAERDQRGERGTTRPGQDAEFARDGGRVVLPFIRVAAETATDYGQTRAPRRALDAAAALPPPATAAGGQITGRALDHARPARARGRGTEAGASDPVGRRMLTPRGRFFQWSNAVGSALKVGSWASNGALLGPFVRVFRRIWPQILRNIVSELTLHLRRPPTIAGWSPGCRKSQAQRVQTRLCGGYPPFRGSMVGTLAVQFLTSKAANPIPTKVGALGGLRVS